MDKEFYHFLYNLRSSGFFYPTQEITRQLLFFSRTMPADAFQQFSLSENNILMQKLDGEVGTLSDDTIVNCRNMLISVAVTMNMIAIDHYVDHQTSNSLCDFYIRKAETIHNLADFASLSASLLNDFHELLSCPPWPSYGRLADRCIDYINQCLYSPLTVENVAAHMGYSSTYLTTLFKQKTGMTLYTFIQHCKILEAQRILLCTQQSLTSIASSLGYNSLSHFSKAFKTAVGITPRQFRNTDPIQREKHVNLFK